MFAHLTSLARRLAGLATLALVVAGVPWALLRYLPTPLPDRLPTWGQITSALASPLSDDLLGAVLVGGLWLAWAAFMWSLIAELAAVVAGIRLPQPRAFAPARGVAALLVAAITGGVLATAAHAAPAAFAAVSSPPVDLPTSASAPASTAQPPVSPVRAPGAPTQAAPAGQMTVLSSGRAYTCTVASGDTLSGLAQAWLGDANRWPEIFALNRGTHFTHPSGTMSNPNLIRPGWTLELPDDATPPAGAVPNPPATSDAPGGNSGTEAASSPEPAVPAPAVGPSAAADGDDGVNEPTPSASTNDGAAAQAPSDPADTDGADVDPAGKAPDGVDLPSGSWLDLGLVAAVLAAVGLVWAHRQRRHTRRPLTADPHDPAAVVDPLPPVVSHLRRGQRRQATRRAVALRNGEVADLVAYRGFFDDLAAAEHTQDEPADKDDADALDGLRDEAAGYTGEAVDGAVVYDDSEPGDVEPADVAPTEDSSPEAAPSPVTPALQNPVARMWPSAGLGLVGPGAEAATRGFLVATLAAGGVDDPHTRGQVVIPAGTLATLLGAAAVAVPDSPRLTVTGNLGDALALLEAQILHRTRILYDAEVNTAAELRESDPTAEPLPPLVLIADHAAAHQRARIAALLVQGQRLDIHGILLGAWPDGDTVTVDTAGATTAAGPDARHSAHAAGIGRLAVLTADEASDLLRLLGEAHTGEAPRPVPDETMSTTAVENADVAHDDKKTASKADLRDATPPAEAEFPDGDTASAEPADIADAEPGERSAPARKVRVTVLGRPTILDAPAGQRLRPQAVELLVYLVARGGSAHQDEIFEDLMPEAPLRRAPHRLNTYLYNLRLICKHIGGDGTYVRTEQKRYTLNRDAFDLDLWQMNDAITDAAAADDPQQRVQALHRAVTAYTGDLADGHDYLWAESYREAIRRRHLDAVLILAETLTTDTVNEPRAALTVLTDAMTHHPYCEELTRAAMRIHANLGEAEAIRAAHRNLARRLDDIDAEPDDATVELADELLTRIRHRPKA